MTAAADQQLWTRRFLWLLAGVFVFRLVYVLTVVDFQIGGDEAYYWDWGRRPDWCYYSKPPLIGWLMALLRVTFGYQWWSVRLAALLLGTCSMAMMFALGRRAYDARTGFFAALMLLCTPASALGNFIFTIDSPLVLCWTAALFLFWRAVEEPDKKLSWVLLAFTIGVGSWAKLMMLVFPLVMVIFACVSKQSRGLLKRPAFWLCIVGGLAMLTPQVWWQMQHDWVTLHHEKEHLELDQESIQRDKENSEHKGFSLIEWVVQVLRFPVLQSLTYSPLTFGVMMVALWWCWKNWRTAGDRERFLLVFSAPALLVFQAMAFRQYINENWPAVFFLSAFALGASTALTQPRLETWMHRGWKLGGGLLLVIYVMIPLVPVMGLTGHRKLDPAAPMRGWHESAQQISEMLGKVPRPDKTFVLVLDHRHNASQMAFHLAQHPTVYRWNRETKLAPESQYEVWPDAADKVGWDCFVIFPDSADDHYAKKGLHHLVRQAFQKTRKLGDAGVVIGNGAQRTFQIFLAEGMKHWPEHEPRGSKP